LVVWLIGWLFGWLAGWFIWLVGLVGCLVDRLVVWLVGWLAGWFIWLVGLVGCLAVWLVGFQLVVTAVTHRTSLYKQSLSCAKLCSFMRQ
jgi:hypothetical protein